MSLNSCLATVRSHNNNFVRSPYTMYLYYDGDWSTCLTKPEDMEAVYVHSEYEDLINWFCADTVANYKKGLRELLDFSDKTTKDTREAMAEAFAVLEK